MLEKSGVMSLLVSLKLGHQGVFFLFYFFAASNLQKYLGKYLARLSAQEDQKVCWINGEQRLALEVQSGEVGDGEGLCLTKQTSVGSFCTDPLLRCGLLQVIRAKPRNRHLRQTLSFTVNIGEFEHH